MYEGRRHSVDIPLSQALVALSRVRTLRDPSTNSICSLPGSAENPKWETSSCGGIELGLARGPSDTVGSLKQSPQGAFCSSSEANGRLWKLPVHKATSSSKVRVLSTKGEDPWYTKRTNALSSRLSFEAIHEQHLFDGNGSACFSKYCHPLGEEDPKSCSENKPEQEVFDIIDKKQTKRLPGSGVQHSELLEDAKNSAASDCPSDAEMGRSGIATSIFADNESNLTNSDRRACGNDCYSSRTLTSRHSDLISDVDRNQPFMHSEREESDYSGSISFRSELPPKSESPRTLSDKYRPASFHELVGQHVVSQSLSSAISKHRVASVYLFHGPRGTGKTSMSRIFAAALNCLCHDKEKPCGVCRHCTLFYAEKLSSVCEMDAADLNRTCRIKSLLGNASIPPHSSRVKVFIVDDCHLLKMNAWGIFINALDDLPGSVVFILITDDLDKLPRNIVSRSQRYHFTQIRDADIVDKLVKICIQERLDFDKAALLFLASKSNGSLRDAELMLDQLSLLGQRITISLVQELSGIVSNEELLDLLDLALSSDPSSTIRRARELISSMIDPIQLVSQLAHLIMDILAGRCDFGTDAGKLFQEKHTELANGNLENLRHALTVLSETEKQLRLSKNQTTWLIAGLLQFSASNSPLADGSDSVECSQTPYKKSGLCNESSKLDHLTCTTANVNGFYRMQPVDIHRNITPELESIWDKMLEKCQSNTLQGFLKKEGKLSSIHINQGMATVVVDFNKREHALQAQKARKLIANSLQLVLGCNVEMKISHAPSKCAKNQTSNHTDLPDIKDLHTKKTMKGNALSIVRTMFCLSLKSRDCEPKIESCPQMDGPNSILGCGDCQELESQPSRFLENLKLQKSLNSTGAGYNNFTGTHPCSQLCFSSGASAIAHCDTQFISSISNTQISSSHNLDAEDRSISDPKNVSHTPGRAPKFHVGKAGKLCLTCFLLSCSR